MATWVASHGKFYNGISQLAFTMPVVNLDIPETNENYWKIWLVGAEHELTDLVGKAAFDDWKTDLPKMSVKETYLAVARQIEWEKLHRLQKAELLDDTTCTCFGLEDEPRCPVCQAMADGMEIPY